MRQYELTHAIYTPRSIDAGVQAFAQICQATAAHGADSSVVTITGADETLDSELLNYILALTAQELL
jgi:hypothetical protein